MKETNGKPQAELYAVIVAVLFIVFWLFSVGSQLSDFNKFKGEMNNQVFSAAVSNVLAYVIPTVEIMIAGLLAFLSTRVVGMILTFVLMLAFSTYIGLAVLNVYQRMPCNCAGLLGQNSSWEANLIFNLFITVVAVIGLIITLKDRERRKKGMGNILSHAPLPA
jgi:hypothetical protein